jgi:hypothetical protein
MIKRLGLFVALALLATLAGQAAAQDTQAASEKTGADTAQKTGSAKTKAEKSKGGELEKQVKSFNATNTQGKEIVAPPNKGGPKTKGAGGCEIDVDNWTPYKIYVVVGAGPESCGLVPAWGGLRCQVTSGNGTIGAGAVFDDGSVFTWGPKDYYCKYSGPYETFTWTLTPF